MSNPTTPTTRCGFDADGAANCTTDATWRVVERDPWGGEYAYHVCDEHLAYLERNTHVVAKTSLLPDGEAPAPAKPVRRALIEWNRYAAAADMDPEHAREQLRVVRVYLPDNYTAEPTTLGILIEGVDSHGWTLDGYVIPRLASGLHFAREITRDLEAGQ